MDASRLYDRRYYTEYTGGAYDRGNLHWRTFFCGIADRIARSISPASVLDMGCAVGFLAEALREIGVDARGVDVSEYAISQVPPMLQPYCRVGSILDPSPGRFDLVVCIEVLEHLEPSDAPMAVARLCEASDDVLMSSSPDEFREDTHFNVQPREYWAGLFAEQGFFHDLDYDASYITPWAMRFRRGRDPVSRTIMNYERRLWRLSREVDTLRSTLLQSRLVAPEDGKNNENTQPG